MTDSRRVQSRRALRYVFVLPLLCAGCDGSTRAPAPDESVETVGDAWFRDVAEERGLSFTHVSGASDAMYFPEIMGGGAAVFDLENDGDLDIYLVQSGRIGGGDPDQPGNRLFRNDAAGEFEDVTEGSGAGDGGYGMGVTTGDYDNDGLTDLYVTNVGPNALLGNRGGLAFEDVSRRADVAHHGWGTSCAFVDTDHDGDLDLYVANYIVWSPEDELQCRESGLPDYCSPNSYQAPAADVLYENQGDGRFLDISARAGMRTAFGNGLGVVCDDYDNDGSIDIFVANDQLPNQLWRNNGDGTFRDVAVESGAAIDASGQAKAGMGVTAADIDDDGDSDLLVVNLETQSDSFYRNEGAYFLDDTPRVGLGLITRKATRFGVGLYDFDNDGWLDLFEANGRVTRPKTGRTGHADPYAEADLLLAGGPSGRFEPFGPPGGTVASLIATSRAAAFGDLENDGGMDIVIVNRDHRLWVLHNIAPRQHWILFRVEDADGGIAHHARVTVSLGDRMVTRSVRVASSYCAANDPRVHFGLGRQDEVRQVRVTWQDGHRESFGPFRADQIVRLRRTAHR